MRAALRTLFAAAAVVCCVMGLPAAVAGAATPVGAGNLPDAVVDREGRTHVVWNESRSGAPDVLHYCRIPFGAVGCNGDEQTFTPAGPANGNVDFEGPHVRVTPLGEVLLLTTRCCGVNPKPGSRPANVIFRSESDGDPGTWDTTTGTVIGNVEAGAAAAAAPVVFDDVDRRVLTAAGRTLGMFVQAQPLGQNTEAAAQLDTENAYSPSVVMRGRNSFVAAWARLDGTTYVRTYDCTGPPGACPAGRPNTASTWSPAVAIPGAEDPQLVAGPTGTFLITRAPDRSWQVRRIDGNAVGAPQPVSAPDAGARAELGEGRDGRLHALYVGENANLLYRTSLDGVSWTLPHEVQPGPDFTIGDLALAAGQADAGPVGLSLWEVQPGGDRNPLIVGAGLPDPATLPYSVPQPPIPSIPQIPGVPKVPGLPGGGGTPPAQPCQLVSFGPLDVVADACFKREGTTFTATGGVRINGLSVRLEPGAKITFDTKARTVESSGTVTVRAESIVLWQGKIDWKIPAGTTWDVGELDVGKAGGDLLGFPLKGKAALRLRRGAAEIPVHVGLPALFGGVSGDVTIAIDNAGGLRVRDLSIKVANAFMGVIQVKDLSFTYQADEDVWQGAATLILPPQPPGPSLSAAIGFRQGEFDYARGSLTFPGAGIPLDPFSVVYLQRIGFSVETRPDLKLAGTVGLSAGPKIGDVRAVGIDGTLSFTFPDGKPAILRADGKVSVVDIALASAFFELRTNGYIGFGGRLDLNVPLASVKADFSGVMLGTRFNVEAGADVCVGEGVLRVCAGGRAVVSSVGFAGCANVVGLSGGLGYRWGDTPELFSGCDVGPYRATIAQAGGGGARTFSVPSGARGAFVAVRGAGAAPAVAVVGPDGRRVEVPAAPTGPIRGADFLATRSGDTTWFVLARPAAGAWRVEKLPGSAAPIRAVDHAQALPEPAVRASVRRAAAGGSRARVLSYSVEPVPGQRVWFAERGGAAAKVVGVARGAAGTLRWTPADGPGGTRRIVAVVEQDGMPRAELPVASYVAPAPVVPGAPRGLRVRRAGSGAVVTWRPSSGPVRSYLVRARLSDGRVLLVPATRTRRRATLPAITRTTTGTIQVTAVRADARQGRPARTTLRRARGR